MPTEKKSVSGVHSGCVRCPPACRIASLRRCLWACALQIERLREWMRRTESLTMSPQEEHLNRIVGSTFRVQILDNELELSPVSRARIEQTESIRQLEVMIDLYMLSSDAFR
jgi:hypothetical protein